MGKITATGHIAEPTSEGHGHAMASLAAPPAARQIGVVNWLGVWTLYVKEVQRFFKVFAQTLLAPIVTTLLFLAIFTLAFGGATRGVAGIDYDVFLAPGLIMMAIIQNAFANTSSTMMVAKIQGNIVDMLMPPLSPGELTFAFVMGGVTRGVLVGLVVAASMAFIVPTAVHSLWAIVFFAVSAASLLSLIGLVAAIWADKFDHMAAITNFVITPLSFLSGTFYSVERLPGIWHALSQLNPFFYMIDGLRYGFIGRADGDVMVGAAVLIVANVVLWWVAVRMFATGYKLKE